MSELSAREAKMAEDLADELRKTILRWSTEHDDPPGDVDMRVYTRAIKEIIEDMDEGVNQAIEELMEDR